MMSGHLLLVVLLYSVSHIKTQALLPPKLMVNPSVITETDTVTLNCQTPSSVSVHQCYFHIGGEPARSFPCLKTLRGTELLEMTRQSPPAEVKVTCFYLLKVESPESDTSSIIIQTSLVPKLTVNPPAIKETDAVTLNCQTPSSVSVSQCYFYTVSGGYVRGSSCLRTLTGTELLKVSQQSSPAVVEVICYYTVKFKESPRSDIFSVTIKSQKPKMSVQHFHGDQVLFTCSLPESVHHETKCNLYFGEADRPAMTSKAWRKTNIKVETSFCQFTVSISDLLSHLSSVQQSDASCDYSLGSKLNPLSPRSDGYSLTDIVEKESQTTQAIQTLSVTTALHRPKLTVNPSVITQKDVVTLNCEAPSSVPVPECYFNTLSGESPKNLPCLTTLTATELLKMSHQSSTSVVKVICCYRAKFGENNYVSPYSETTSVTILILLPPKLTLNPAVITETDSVTLNCQTPSSVSVSHCFIYTGRQENIIGFSCLRTLKGADLLSMTRQSSPAVIEVKCYYTVKLGELNSPSPHSETSPITVQNIVESESRVVPTQTPLKNTSESRMMQTKSTIIMSTDLTAGRLSSSTAETTAKQPSGLTVSRTSKTDGFISTSLTPVKPTSVGQILDGWSTRSSLLPPLDKASETFILKLIVGVVGFGVSVGVLLLILLLLSKKRRTERRSQKRTQAIVTDDSMCMRNLNHTQLSPAGNDEAYSLITSIPGADCPTDSEKLKRQEYHNEDSDIYHVYSTIPEEPPLSVSKDMVYSTVQAH